MIKKKLSAAAIKAGIEKNRPWLPPAFELHHVTALQALSRGEANENQQKDALDWIINECCKTYDISYRPDSERDTSFAEGKRFVVANIVRLLKTSTAKLRGDNNSEQP